MLDTSKLNPSSDPTFECESVGGGVRLRSSLSAEEAQNQKLCLGAEIGFYFINSCILGAYYMKSYKKCGQKAQYLEIT